MKVTHSMTNEEFKGFQLGLLQRHPLFVIDCYDGDNNHLVEIDHPLSPVAIPLDKLCKFCRHPNKSWVPMNEEAYGKGAILCVNCEKLSYLGKPIIERAK